MNSTKSHKIIDKYISVKKYHEEQYLLWKKHGYAYPTGKITVDYKQIKTDLKSGKLKIEWLIESLEESHSLDLLDADDLKNLILYNVQAKWCKDQEVPAKDIELLKKSLSLDEAKDLLIECLKNIPLGGALTWSDYLYGLTEAILIEHGVDVDKLLDGVDLSL